MSDSEIVVERRPGRSPFELRALTGLPCGCVVGDFQAATLDVELVSIEAKGPHCDLDDHHAEGVLAIGCPTEIDTRQLHELAIEQLAA